MNHSEIKKAILFINPKKENSLSLAREIREVLGNRGFKVQEFTLKGKSEFKTKTRYDIAFSLGGDGTVLFSIRAMAPLGVPVFPINLGTLGFIAAVHPSAWLSVFDAWLDGSATVSRRLMLEAGIERGGRIIRRVYCLNDFVISALGIAKIIRLQVFASDGDFNYLSLGQYHSDGLIIATPTGSTAYSVAAGGPILDPEMEAMILNPICPFTLSYRPMVLPAHETLIVEVQQEQRSGVLLTVDGQVTEPLESGDKVYVSQAQWHGILVASDRKIFYHALKTKLSWLETPGRANDENGGVKNA